MIPLSWIEKWVLKCQGYAERGLMDGDREDTRG